MQTTVGMGWISVHDRLPKDGQRVLVFDGEWYVASFDVDGGLFWLPSAVPVPDATHWLEIKMPGEE